MSSAGGAKSEYLRDVPNLVDVLAPLGGIDRADPERRAAELASLTALIRMRRETWERDHNCMIPDDPPYGWFAVRRACG